MNTDSCNMFKTAATLIYLYIVLVVSLQSPSYHDTCWPKVLSPFTWAVIHQRCYWLMLHWYLHTYLHCSNEMWVMSFESLVHITFYNDPFYLHRGLVILSSSSILQHSEHFSVFCYPGRGWRFVVTSVQQLQGIFFYIFTCETPQWANILQWFFSHSYHGAWSACLISM